MNFEEIKPNKNFIGREYELHQLDEIKQVDEASIIIVYGRRRVGKTELLEQAFRDRHLFKFEGIEGKTQAEQRRYVLKKLADYVGEPLIAKVKSDTWLDVFEAISLYIKEGECTLYFEELQWLADYQKDFITELKHAWDNEWRHNPKLILILCGSSPSFMINQVVHSKALYNRSQYEMALKPFSLAETAEYLSKRSEREIMDAYLTIGGIPEYLKRIKKKSSTFLGLCDNAFRENSFFSSEYERIFISSLANNIHYKKIVDFLSKRRFATRNEIAKYLKLNRGGSLTRLLEDLEECRFIQKYTPFNLHDDSKLARYCVSDAYLQFYFKFIKPIKKRIDQGDYNQNPASALNMETYFKWLGFAFERFCRNNSAIIAKILGFQGIQYKAGAFFNRNADEALPGYQIDLAFDRADNVYTICEIKYLQTKVSLKVIEEMEKKLSLFPSKGKTIQKVLITSEGAQENLINRAYFDKIITLKDLFSHHA